MKKQLKENFTSLAFIQASNYLFPLITFPYLVRVLGPEKYGLINFALAFIGYFSVLTDYGFNLSATREVSINRDDKKKISEIFSAVITIKFLLLFTSLILIIALIFLIPFFYEHKFLYMITFGAVFGNVLFPQWFFQGIEKMKYLAYINIFPKAVVAVCIFLLIKSEDDFLFVAILNSSGFIAAGVAAFLISISKFGISFIIPSTEQILFHLKEGWHVFISTVSISLYTISNTFILGLFAGNTVVGYFTAADKIRQAIQQLFSIVQQTVYPHLSEMLNKSKEEGIRFLQKLIRIVGGSSLAAWLIVVIFADQIILLVVGNEYLPSITVLRIIAALPFLIMLSNIYGIQTLLNLGFKSDFSKVIIAGAVINILLSLILVPVFFEIGTAVSVVTAELIVTLGMIYYCRDKKIYLLKERYV